MKNHHVIITGATRGIGRATALHYAAKGWAVSICSHSSASILENARCDIETAGGQCFAFLGDMGKYEDASTFIQKAVKTFGIPDVLINNAGISHIGLLQDMTPEEWDHILQTNLSSAFYTCKTIIPYFLQTKKGYIINISSVWGNVGASTEAAYSATKGGINALTKALAKELTPSGIPVNAIACGFIDTSMNASLNPQEQENIFQEIPAGRAGLPEEVARLTEQLIKSPEYLTGQVITMDGGWT